MQRKKALSAFELLQASGSVGKGEGNALPPSAGLAPQTLSRAQTWACRACTKAFSASPPSFSQAVGLISNTAWEWGQGKCPKYISAVNPGVLGGCLPSTRGLGTCLS